MMLYEQKKTTAGVIHQIAVLVMAREFVKMLLTKSCSY
jgi:hypothetical protein